MCADVAKTGSTGHTADEMTVNNAYLGWLGFSICCFVKPIGMLFELVFLFSNKVEVLIYPSTDRECQDRSHFSLG